MTEQPLYKAENGTKMLFRILFISALSIISIFLWTNSPILFSGLIVFSLYQTLTYKYSTIIVYEDRLTYCNKSILNIQTEIVTIHYKDIYEIHFNASEVSLAEINRAGLLALFFPSSKNEVTIWFTNEKRHTAFWGGNVLEIQIACEKANELIALNFNRPKF